MGKLSNVKIMEEYFMDGARMLAEGKISIEEHRSRVNQMKAYSGHVQRRINLAKALACEATYKNLKDLE